MSTAETRQGTVSGTYADGVHAFKGIPYAAPPFGPRRMRPPEPAPAWDGVRDCTRYGPTAPKNPYAPPFDTLLAEPAIPGEDCLNLNVWTPELRGAGLPVLLWIHGGSFTNGSGAVPQYDGTAFARDGVVCVTINYRLGADGFLFLPDGVANIGLLDQVAALEWVVDNIARFGGDPARITIAGESAGAMSVTTLLSMPRAAGLFRRVIAASGAGQHVLSPATATRVGGYVAEKLGVPATREAIAAIPVQRLLAAQTALGLDLQINPDPARWGEIATNLMVFEPVVDGDIVPAVPLDAIRQGAGRDVDVLIGTNTDEWRFFVVPPGVLEHITDALLQARAAAHGLGDAALELYRTNRPGATAGDVYAALVTDWFFWIPAIRVAEARSESPTWVYEFGWKSPVLGGQLGACHYVEVPFVFDALRSEGAAPMVGSAPPQGVADDVHLAWVRFVTSGDPGWPRYEAADRATMLFDTHSDVVHDLRAGERRLWDGLR
ncbi:MAG TPA: carboxylesterase/lipase family protein [Streptosporangiaceae bacterium]|nr:carboxylesterase/lipase family protein [Streptosporangiaceae bacterium]